MISISDTADPPMGHQLHSPGAPNVNMRVIVLLPSSLFLITNFKLKKKVLLIKEFYWKIKYSQNFKYIIFYKIFFYLLISVLKVLFNIIH